MRRKRLDEAEAGRPSSCGGGADSARPRPRTAADAAVLLKGPDAMASVASRPYPAPHPTATPSSFHLQLVGDRCRADGVTLIQNDSQPVHLER